MTLVSHTNKTSRVQLYEEQYKQHDVTKMSHKQKLAGQTMDKALAATTNEHITETTNGQDVTQIISSWVGHRLLVG